MHELSIANNLVQLATEYAQQANASKVTAMTLRIGLLSCVHKSALEYSFEIVTEGTIAEGAALHIIDVPVAVFCTTCEKTVELEGIQKFRCPVCDTPSGDIRSGKELDLESIEVEELDQVSKEQNEASVN